MRRLMAGGVSFKIVKLGNQTEDGEITLRRYQSAAGLTLHYLTTAVHRA